MNHVTDKKALQFINEVSELALKLGLDYFVVTRGGMTMSNNISNDVDVKHAQASYYEFHKKFDSMRFGDLIKYFDTLSAGIPDEPLENGKFMITKKATSDGLNGEHSVSVHEISNEDDWKMILKFEYVDQIPSITLISRDKIHHTFNIADAISKYDWASTGHAELRGFFMDVIGSMNNK